MAIPSRIRARIHDSAISRVTRAYDAGLASIFAELLQNSRRAGATRVHISLSPADHHHIVTVADDGAGIQDPAVLLSFGENGWDRATVQREDAAGMGTLSLARRTSTVSSRPRFPDSRNEPGWSVTLAPDHFLGHQDADVTPDSRAPFPHGTSITFPAPESPTAIRTAAEAAAFHYPLPVRFRDITAAVPVETTLPAQSFLQGAACTEGWNGIVFGVFHDRPRAYRKPDLNFFGLGIHVALPDVETVHGATWTVRADVHDCPDLELVLPAREKPVENDFLQDMREAARTAIYRAMSSHPSPRPTYRDWSRARASGIELAPPTALLQPWRPSVADSDDWREQPRFAPPGDTALLVAFDPEAPDAQTLWRAADRNGIAPRLFEPDARLEGYGWYDRLARITAIDTQITTADAGIRLKDWPGPERDPSGAIPLPPRPQAIALNLTIRSPAAPADHLVLPADLAFAGEPWSWVSDAMPLVTAESPLAPHQLADLIQAAFFAPSDDSEADSYVTQLDRFRESALHLSTRLLLSDEEASRTTIAEAVHRELIWLAPADRTITITIRRPEVTVAIADRDAESDA